jgi:hypothetical protein
MRTLEQRFWAKVDKAGPLLSPYLGPCWDWTASQTDSGYGRIRPGDGTDRWLRAHRVAYEIVRGPIPPGLTLDHLCRRRVCVNPAHLEPLPLGDNVLRGVGLTAQNARKTHCKRGHLLDVENTYIDTRGHRRCRRCHRERMAQR